MCKDIVHFETLKCKETNLYDGLLRFKASDDTLPWEISKLKVKKRL